MDSTDSEPDVYKYNFLTCNVPYSNIARSMDLDDTLDSIGNRAGDVKYKVLHGGENVKGCLNCDSSFYFCSNLLFVCCSVR